MSYWVYLEQGGESVVVDEHCEGGTFAVGGLSEAELNVTYNYGPHIRKHLHSDGLKWLQGRKAEDCIERLENAVKALGTDRDPDYWGATPGNAGHALSILLRWARKHPEAVFYVS